VTSNFIIHIQIHFQRWNKMSVPELAYWSIRGLAQPIRMLLEYTDTKFTDKEYDCGPAPDFDKSCWFGIKHDLGLEFPNLPYFKDGAISITQSNAILRYIARKNDMCGKTEQEKVWVDMMADEAMDFRNGWVRLCYNPKFADLKGPYLEKTLPSKLDSFEKFLGDRPFFCGDSPTFPDFHMYELLVQHAMLAPEQIDSHKKLSAFIQRFEALPKIKAFKESNRFRKSPINNKMAAFGFE